ncbi:MAG TPA: efflux transporter outer membrane subunit [Rhodocyclaceae bacterium]|nr:efflux transporter outer membrane subunit [Rhodocyclaceae bacterium]
MRNFFALAPLVLTFAACAVTTNTTVPKLDLPAAAQTSPAEDLSQWWLRFNDPALNALIDRALANNTDLKVAAARVDETAAQLRVARSELSPSMDASLGAARRRSTERGSIPLPPGTPQISNTFDAGVNISYEVDLWGRVRSANRAALATLMASREARYGLQSSIAAQVAQAYFNLLGLDRKVALTQQTLGTREQALNLQNKRLDAGSGGVLEVHQAEAERSALSASLPGLLNAQAQAERALALLAGDSPRLIIEGKILRAETLPSPPAVPAGLPSDLLARRPDVRQAETVLAAADANVSEARAHYFPAITLTGSYGRESTDLSNLFTNPATIWSLAGSLVQPIFRLNEIDAEVKAAQARRLQSEAAYVRTVQTAFKEAYDALGSLRGAADAETAQTQRANALRETLRISQLRFDAGLSAYLEVLDAQRNLLTTESDLITSQTEQLSATVDVFRALGGGWRDDTQQTITKSSY